jgi:predicted transcriptional regulator
MSDFLTELIDERTAANPQFPELVDAALERRRLLRELGEQRKELALSQTVVAARMRTSQPTVAKLERAEGDPKLSTIERYAAAVGKRVEWRVVDAS